MIKKQPVPYGEPHNCDESRGDGEVKLACECMLPVVAGALSPDGQLKLGRRGWYHVAEEESVERESS